MTRTGCWLTILALLLGGLLAGPPPAGAAPDLSGTWSTRFSPTSRGTLLLNRPFDGIYFYDPSFDPDAVRKISNAFAETDSGFSLGSGAAANQVMAMWRNGTDFAYFWVQTLPSTTLSAATGPFNYPSPVDPNANMNPEWVGIADGCIFIVLQHFDAGNMSVKNVFKVTNPATGAVQNLTNTPLTPGAPQVVTSDCQAAWTIRAGTGTPQLQLYDGASVRDVDAGTISGFRLAHGRLVYTKVVGGIGQIFAYDSTAASPAPVQLSFDAAGSNMNPTTDGRHVAWIHVNSPTSHDVVLGGVVLTTDPTTRHDPTEIHDYPLQYHRGHLIWKDAQNRLLYHDGRGIRALEIAPATNFDRQWLADGFVAYRETAPATVNVLATGVPPGPVQPTPLALETTPGNGQATVNWDRIVGASSYFVYVARESGLTAQNWQSRRGGRKIPVPAPPFTLTGVQNGRIYEFVVSAIVGGVEGPGSRSAAATLLTGESWLPGTGTGGVAFNAVAADALDPLTAYAGTSSGAYKTTDGGASWAPLGGVVAGRSVKALAARGGIVNAVTADGDILRSTDAGASWTIVADGDAPVGNSMSIAIDPLSPTTLYAGAIRLPVGFSGDSYVVKSTDGGASWVHTPSAPSGLPSDLIPYATAIDPLTAGRLYIGGTGEHVARSSDGGASWVSMNFPDYAYALAIDPTNPNILYAGAGGAALDGVFKTYGDRTWSQRNTGLPGTLPQINALLIDPSDPSFFQAGTTAGYFFSRNGGESWTAFNTGLPGTIDVRALAMTPSHHLLAATSAGMYQVDLSLPAGISGIVTGAGPGGASQVRGFTGTGIPTALSFLVYPPGFTGGVRVAVGDVNGGGAAELITAAGPGGGPHIRVFSGPTASTVLTEFLAYDPGLTQGLFVAAGDVNGDGTADIVTGVAPGGGPHVKVFSLATGTPVEIRSFFAYAPAFTGGITVAVGDVDNDGFADIITGAGPGGGPHVQVFSGRDGSVIRSFMAYGTGMTAGIFVASADVDGDGFADIITGVGAGGGPHVQVFSGRTGEVLASFFAYDPGATVGMRVAAADLDGNGKADIITAPGAGGGPHVKAFRRNADGTVTEIASFFAYDPGFTGGVFVGGGR